MDATKTEIWQELAPVVIKHSARMLGNGRDNNDLKEWEHIYGSLLYFVISMTCFDGHSPKRPGDQVDSICMELYPEVMEYIVQRVADLDKARRGELN